MMTTNKHTPGPWTWWTSNSWRRLKRDDLGITQNVLEPYVCRDGHPDLSVSEADALLIAAAPDLLTALKDLVDPSNEWVVCFSAFNVKDAHASRLLEAARIAIAKAEGRTS